VAISLPPTALADFDKALGLAPDCADAYLYGRQRNAMPMMSRGVGGRYRCFDLGAWASGGGFGTRDLATIGRCLDDAQSDWLSVIKTGSDSDEARAARARIDALASNQ
jgi:hypothetical protein